MKKFLLACFEGNLQLVVEMLMEDPLLINEIQEEQDEKCHDSGRDQSSLSNAISLYRQYSPQHQYNTTFNGANALHLACLGKHMPVVQYLVENTNIDLNKEDDFRRNCFFYVLYEKETKQSDYSKKQKKITSGEIFQYLFGKFDLETAKKFFIKKDLRRFSPLYYLASYPVELWELFFNVCEQNNALISKEFLNEIIIPDKITGNPLFHAIESHNQGVVEFLMQHQVKIIFKDEEYPLSFAYALSANNYFEMLCSLLKDLNNIQDFDMVNFINSKPIDSKLSFIDNAVKCNNIEMVKMLIAYGASYNSDLLFVACEDSNYDMFKFLVEELKLDISVCDSMGNNLLHVVYYGKERVLIMYFLLEHNLNLINTPNKCDQYPLDIACSLKENNLMKIFFQFNVIVKPLLYFETYEGKNYQGMQTRNSFLCNLFEMGEVELIGLIFSKLQAELNSESLNDFHPHEASRRTLFHWACIYGSFNILQHISENNNKYCFDLNQTDVYGYTPLILLMLNKKNPSCVEFQKVFKLFANDMIVDLNQMFKKPEMYTMFKDRDKTNIIYYLNTRTGKPIINNLEELRNQFFEKDYQKQEAQSKCCLLM